MDAVHPKHNPVMACGWIKKGKDFQICSNSGRQRLNINGAVSLDTMKLDMRYDNPKDHIASLRSLLTENFSDN